MNESKVMNQKQESYESVRACYIFKEKFENRCVKDKKYHKVRSICHYIGEYRSAAHSVCNLKYSVPKQTRIVFHNGFNYDYHFTKKRASRRI